MFLLQYDSVHGRMDGDITGESHRGLWQSFVAHQGHHNMCYAACSARKAPRRTSFAMTARLSSASCVMEDDVNTIMATGTNLCRSSCPPQLLLTRVLLVQEMRKICMSMASPSRSSLPCKCVKARSSYTL